MADGAMMSAPKRLTCLVCHEQEPDPRGQHVGVWAGLSLREAGPIHRDYPGPVYVVCKRCVQAGLDARRRANAGW